MGTIGKARTRRVVAPMPGGELLLEPPPELERVVPGGMLARLLPIGMIVASIAMMWVLARANPSMWMFGAMMVLSSIAMLVSGNSSGQGGAARAAGLDEDRRDYLRYLGVQRDRVDAVAAAQRAALLGTHPDPAAWPDVVAAGRHWERVPADADFAQVRVALGVQRLATRLTAPETGPVDGVEPVTAAALRRFLGRHSVVADLPVALDLRSSATVWLERTGADPGPARGLARAIVAQFVLWHGPADAVVAVLAADPAPWDWVKWLPHNAHGRTVDALGPVRLVASDPDELRALLAADLAARPPGPGPAEPHVLLVVDGVDGPGPWAGVAGVTVLRAGAPPGRRAAPSVVRLAVGPGTLGRVAPDGAIAPIGVPDSLDPAEAAALARRLARFRPAGVAAADDGTPVAAQDLPALLGVPGRPTAADVEAVRTRRRRTAADRLRVPLGVDEDGRPLLLDLKESAQGGSGPHGLCVGATGSGNAQTDYGTLPAVTATVARRVALYLRISRDKSGAGLGVDRQRAECQALADKLGWVVVATFEDNDMSAYSGKPRPGYRALLDAIQAGTVDTVVAWHTDRLHRSPSELEEWIEVCDPRGVEVHTVKAGPIDLATPSGRMVARVLGGIARYESEHRSERIASKNDEIVRRGGFLGGVRPFGYTADGMQLEPGEAKMITAATRAILDGGSLRTVVKEWNATGRRTTKSGQAWSSSSVRDVLMRGRNAGLVQHRGRIVGPASWPAIVSEDEWRGVCALLGSPSRRTSPGNEVRWLGSLLYQCGVCAETMIVGTSGQHRHPSYKCRGSDQGGPRHVTRQAAALDEFVEQVIVTRLSLDDAREMFAPHRPDVDVTAIRADLARIDQHRTDLAERLGSGEISIAMMDAANRPLLARQAEMERALADAAIRSPLAELVDATDVAAEWARLPLQMRRSILDELMTVTVLPAPRGRRPGGGYFDPEYVRIEWKGGEA
ncbi:hypothetical protein PSU4_17030 [Pseudonocardia sulfidoxydans NBRC 16205]|uniref:Serine recombinase n=1 Tax=Pseudonocardia sulfidoxydans NBRC 16205 TaxID=1223511 RepID=A0A511DD76_9PSEU|nr:recombinase family protein [Pseudonocardia sulfidoxydans]GEL22749.1 hypothetical protein PSU4_17030 [Pseudonocardia sulfidoxydans NBRC 16205]